MTLLFYFLIVMFTNESMVKPDSPSQFITQIEPYPIQKKNFFNEASISIYTLGNWYFSAEKPDSIQNGVSLKNAQAVSMVDLMELRTSNEWKNYGWFEYHFTIDTALHNQPFVLGYRGLAAIRCWLNGEYVGEFGKPASHPENQVLSSMGFLPNYPVVLSKNVNHLLVEMSDFNTPHYFDALKWDPKLLTITLQKPGYWHLYNSHSLVFGASIFLVCVMIGVIVLLIRKFPQKKSYNYFFLSLVSHVFWTISGASVYVFPWTYDYYTFLVLTDVISPLAVVTFLLIGIHAEFKNKLPVKLISIVNFVLLSAYGYALFYQIERLNEVHLVTVAAGFCYVVVIFFQAKQEKMVKQIRLLLMGVIGVYIGSTLSTVLYHYLELRNDWIQIGPKLVQFTGIPLLFMLFIGRNYSDVLSSLEQKVKSRTQELEKANEYKSKFLANISHEFRTPITILSGLFDRMSTFVPDEKSEYKSQVRRNLKRLNSMVNQVLQLTRLENDALTLTNTNVRIKRLLTVIIESFNSLALIKHQQLTVNFLNDIPDYILTDQEKVEIIVSNLVSNAIKFAPEKGIITVLVSYKNQELEIQVHDNGKGIDESDRERIFERFYRLQHSSENYVEGTGIGLELARTFARLLGGELVCVESAFLKGACFILTLPVLLSDETVKIESTDSFQVHVEHTAQTNPTLPVSDSTKEKTGSVVIRHSENKRILLVEDNADMRSYIKETIQDTAEIITASNGKKAVEILQSGQNIDLIITDMMMPEMNGYELVDFLKQSDLYKRIPVIVLTARIVDEDKLHLLRIGIIDFMTKPFKSDELKFKVASLLNLSEERKKYQLVIKQETQKEDKLIEKIGLYLFEHAHDQNVNVEQLAEEFAMSRRTLYRFIEAETGMSVANYIREIRLNKARLLLQQEKATTIEEIAAVVGYKNSRSFRLNYQERFGKHPLEDKMT